MNSYHSNSNSYKQEIAAILGVPKDHIHLYWKGRVALYAILKALGIGKGDEVILPAYTCVVVPNAIIYLGAKPVYVDICKHTFNMNTNLIEEKINSKTKAIIAQNTYGLSSGIEDIKKLACKHGLFTIEDCTHGFGGTYKGRPNGTNCDASFFSTQWNKPFSSGIGGFSYIRPDSLNSKVELISRKLFHPGKREELTLKTLYIISKTFLKTPLYWKMVDMYRLLSRFNFIIGSSSGAEIGGISKPHKYFKGLSDTQAREGLKNLQSLPNVLTERANIAYKLTNHLAASGKIFVPHSLSQNHSFLKYPILVKDRREFMNLARKNHVVIGDWFRSPLHPVEDHLEKWNFVISQYPIAEKVSKHVVTLETSQAEFNKTLAFLESTEDLIL